VSPKIGRKSFCCSPPSLTDTHRSYHSDGTGLDILSDSKFWILVHGQALCQKHLAYSPTSYVAWTMKREKWIYFVGVFIILDFGNSFSLTIHFYLLTKQQYQIWNSFSFVIPPLPHTHTHTTPVLLHLKSGSMGFSKQNKLQPENLGGGLQSPSHLCLCRSRYSS